MWALYHLVPSADNFCKQFGPRSDPTKRRAWSWFNLCDTDHADGIPERIFRKVDFEEKSAEDKKNMKILPGMGGGAKS